ncbi:Coiled-coil domain-containing protein 50 [Heterocephalus glaber]|uniref:Coiled-coil domain-containing protein 50 n=1 Tax=Heterocephalus glaber TaxID=10181 RepID=G5BX21_HETGA|nr:Coiled-coil domain-containing protein 50 [Heterocephalus glaber]
MTGDGPPAWCPGLSTTAANAFVDGPLLSARALPVRLSGVGASALQAWLKFKLPGVKEVGRDFAVLEDHTLARNLQEQEIEHHLASNIQRNCLVQHDLQVAQQLQDQEWYDAKIARKLQEEEIWATQEGMRVAQVAQDEEIARLLMAEEKKAYKKAKQKEKTSSDKKHEPEWKSKTAKPAHSKSQESDEAHRWKTNRPGWPPLSVMTEAEDLDGTHFTNHHSSTHLYSKSESSHKGFHYKQ